MIERTLCILKPDCVRKNLQGEVLARIQKAGFKVLGMKQIRLTREEAGAFYAVHKGRPFYDGLVDFMTSGPCVPVALEKLNAVGDYRMLIGATDPKDADPVQFVNCLPTAKERISFMALIRSRTAGSKLLSFLEKTN